MAKDSLLDRCEKTSKANNLAFEKVTFQVEDNEYGRVFATIVTKEGCVELSLSQGGSGGQRIKLTQNAAAELADELDRITRRSH